MSKDEKAAQERESESMPGPRRDEQTLWVDIQIRQAMERGAFDNLPGSGKPIPGLDGEHDPDWYAKKLIEREQLTGLAPPAIALRTENLELDQRLDRETSESEVRRIIADFNARIVAARRQLLGGPPVITPTRDIDAELRAWRDRREQRRAAQRQQLQRLKAEQASTPKRRWWHRRTDRTQSA